MRISIIGLSGSGKSTLAQNISQKFTIPHIHIDRLWFEAGGHKPSSRTGEEREKIKAYIRNKTIELIQQDSWVSDGWYSYVQILIAERADEIVFLDISLPRRLFSHLWRTFFEERHTELTKWDDIKFVYQIVRRTFAHGPKMREFVRQNADKVKTLHSFREVDRYFAELH